MSQQNLGKLKSFWLPELTICSAGTWLTFKYVFKYASSLTSLSKSDCAAIDSPHNDKQLWAPNCQPVNHVFLTFPSALRISSSSSPFPLHASTAQLRSSRMQCINVKSHVLLSGIIPNQHQSHFILTVQHQDEGGGLIYFYRHVLF